MGGDGGCPMKYSLLEQLAAVVLSLDLLRGDEAGQAEAHVLLEPRLAVVRLEPGLALLLLEGVDAGPRGEAAEQTVRRQAIGLVDVGRLPPVVAEALLPVLVFRDLGLVVHALSNKLLLEHTQGLVVASATESFAQAELERTDLEDEAIDFLALLHLLRGRAHAVAVTLGTHGLLKAHLADPIAILRLQALLPVLAFEHPIEPVAVHGRACLLHRRTGADEGARRAGLPCCSTEQQGDPGAREAGGLRGHGGDKRAPKRRQRM
mmetsp:Transcript_67557/g.194142  ORF Transcript_67557/g.194142 Transcript_67557/m.194142 type:complete len:263 (-) Transcript_67557:65-853(-)